MDPILEPERRHRPLNYIQLAKNILDGYPFGLAHGLQKDAIQNGWDARKLKSKSFIENNWEFTIELTKLGSNEVIILTDKGTTGLTGKMISSDIKEDTDLPQGERWARWESMAFNKEGSGSLGARGQGKMIFIAASTDHKIYYDSLRSDGSYRYGWTQATTRDCDVSNLDEDPAKERLLHDFGLEPLKEIGTRVIILNPADEVKEAIRNGSLLISIEETWWPIISKFGAKITLIFDDVKHTAIAPKQFPIDPGDESKTFKTWVKENIIVKYLNQNYQIKRICMACDLSTEQEDWIRGIASFRNGMKVVPIPFTTRSLEKKVFGYVEFDEKTDEALRELEMPNHYEFKPIGLWRYIKERVKDEMETFGNEKLGLGVDRRAAESTKKTGSEIKALEIMKKITKNWSVTFGTTGPTGTPPVPPVVDPPVKSVGITLNDFKFPNDNNMPRVEIDDTIDGFRVTAFNKTDSSKKVILRVYVFDEGGETITDLINSEFTIKPRSDISHGPFGFTIEESKYPVGKYALRCILLDGESKTREKIDTLTRLFWVGMDPQLHSPFDLDGQDLPEESWEWTLQNRGGSRYTLYYNQMHPIYMENNDDEDDLGAYLGELCCLGALQLYLREVKMQSLQPDDQRMPVKGPIDPSIITNGDPEELYKAITKEVSTIRKIIRELL